MTTGTALQRRTFSGGRQITRAIYQREETEPLITVTAAGYFTYNELPPDLVGVGDFVEVLGPDYIAVLRITADNAGGWGVSTVYSAADTGGLESRVSTLESAALIGELASVEYATLPLALSLVVEREIGTFVKITSDEEYGDQATIRQWDGTDVIFVDYVLENVRIPTVTELRQATGNGPFILADGSVWTTDGTTGHTVSEDDGVLSVVNVTTGVLFARKYDRFLRSEWFGLKTDGTDTSAEFLNMLEIGAGKEILIPAGTVQLDIPANTDTFATTFADDTVLIGAGEQKTKIVFHVPADAVGTPQAYHTFMRLNHARFEMRNIEIELVHDDVLPVEDGQIRGGIILFDVVADEPTLRNTTVRAINPVQDVGGDFHPTFQAFMFVQNKNGDQIGVKTYGCHFIDVSRTYLRANDKIGTVFGQYSEDDTFEGYYSNMTGFNAPSGSYDGPKIIRPHYINSRSPDIARYCFAIAAAGVRGLVVQDPRFSGQFQIISHVEENSYDISIVNPTGSEDLTCQKFVEVFENDIGGTTRTPEDITIINPRISTGAYTGTGNTQGGPIQMAVDIVSDVDVGVAPVRNMQIIGGAFEGFDYGVYDLSDHGGSPLFVDATYFNCSTNYYGKTLTTRIKMRHGPDTVTHIYTTRSGAIEGHEFNDKAPVISGNAGAALGMYDYTVVYTDVPAAAGTTVYDVMPVDAGTRVEGNIVSAFSLVTTDGHAFEKAALTFDGTTSTVTLGIFASDATTQGGVAASEIAHPSGSGSANRPNAFAISTFNGAGAERIASLTAKFSGLFLKEF